MQREDLALVIGSGGAIALGISLIATGHTTEGIALGLMGAGGVGKAVIPAKDTTASP